MRHDETPPADARSLSPSLSQPANLYETDDDTKSYHALDTTWIPFSLRKINLAILAFVLILSIVALELVDRKLTAMAALPSKDKHAVRALQYVPTVVAILIGFGWKGLCSDLGVITPWAALSRGTWVKASDSILLNYIDSLDIISLKTALQHHHWILALVIACGLLSGSLVPLTTALSQELLVTGRNNTYNVTMADKFQFNGSLAIPMGWRSVQPLMDSSISAVQETERGTFPWLTTWHAYPSINTSAYDSALLEATVDSFSASLSCDFLTYTGTYSQDGANSSFVLEALDDGLCDSPVSQQVIWPYNSSSASRFPTNNDTGLLDIPPFLWSNITSCGSENDFRWLMTSLVPGIPAGLVTPLAANDSFYSDEGLWQNDSISLRAKGFICKPTYWSIPARITLNTTTGLVGTGPFLHQEAKKEILNIGVGLDVIHAMMNDPTSWASQWVFQAAATNDWMPYGLPNSYDWSQFSGLEVMQKYGYLYLYNYANGYDVTLSPGDGFSLELIAPNTTAWAMFENPEMMADLVNKRFSAMMASLVSAAARTPDTTPITVTMYRPINLFVLQTEVLRALQVILGSLAIVALAVLFFSKVKSPLQHNPTSLDHMTWLVASSRGIEPIFARLGAVGDAQLESCFKDVYCRSIRDSQDRVVLEFSSATSQAYQHVHEEHNAGTTSLDIGGAQPLVLDQTVSSYPQGNYSSTYLEKYKPLALRTGSRAGILFSLGAITVTALILLYHIRDRDGLEATNQTAVSASSIVPSTIMVIVGYCIASLEQGALSLSTYDQIAQNTGKSGRAILRRQISDASKVLVDYQSLDWSRIAFSCFILVITLPAAKLMAGNLYYMAIGYQEIPATFPINMTAMMQINNLSQWVDVNNSFSFVRPVPQLLSQRYAQNKPIYLEYNNLDSLTFPEMGFNMTSLLVQGPQSTANDKLDFRITALNTSVSCSAAEQRDFALFATSCDKTTGYQFQFKCVSTDCDAKFGQHLEHVNVSAFIDSSSVDSGQQLPYFATSFPSASDDSLTVILANFSDLHGPNSNLDELICDGDPVDSKIFHERVPTIQAVNCTRNINLVNVNVTFSRLATGHNNLDPRYRGRASPGQTRRFLVALTALVYSADQQRDWQPTSYDSESIEFIDRAIPQNTYPAPILLPEGGWYFYHAGSELYAPLDPFSFLGLLSQYQDVQTGNHLDLFNIETLKTSTATVYQNYTHGALSLALGNIMMNRLRNFIPESEMPVMEMQNVTGGYYTLYRVVIQQDKGFTISFMTLLLIIVACVTCLTILTSRSTLLTKAPSSIAAQISLIAGSRMVAMLRTEDRRDAPDYKYFFEHNRFGLGWWPVYIGTEVEPAQGKAVRISPLDRTDMRWGIDIGDLADEDRLLWVRRPRRLRWTPSRKHALSRPFQRSKAKSSPLPALSYDPLPPVEMQEPLTRTWSNATGSRWRE